MGYPALKYYVTSEQPGSIEELRSTISNAEDPSSLLAAGYAAGVALGSDFWAAASIDYPSPSVWFHAQRPLGTELLEQQTADINRQAGLARSDDGELPIQILRPQPIARAVQDDAPPVVDELANYRDFVVFSAARPQALVRVGALHPDSVPGYEELAPLVELVGINLGAIARRSGSLVATELVASHQDWSEEQFFELLDMMLADVHQRREELSLMVMRAALENSGDGLLVSEECWQQVWGTLRDGLRETDLPCQLQPGSYVVAMIATNPREAMITADRLRGQLQDLSQSYDLRLRISIGISSWSAGRPGIGRLLWEARQAMQMAAASGALSPFVYA